MGQYSVTSKPRRRVTARWVRRCLLLGTVTALASSPAQAIEWNPLHWFDGSNGQQQAEAPPPAQGPVPIDQPHRIYDLAYGDLLFDYYQEHYFAAITKILVAQQRGSLDKNSEHAQLVLGALYVSYGLLDDGEAIFHNLLNTYATPQAADEAWYQLARIHYKRGNTQQALQILTSNIAEPMESRATEHVLLQILCLIRLGDVAQAQSLTQYLKQDQAPSLFVRFNMGSALAQLGEMEQAAGYYEDVITQASESGQPTSELDKTLTDQASLALGIHYLRNNQLIPAQRTLQRIRLYGPVANRALLALGWSQLRANHDIAALHPWLELSERALTDPAVQESKLNVPYVYERLGALQDALDGYQSAYAVFGEQRTQLDSIKQDIHKPDWIKRISPVDLTAQQAMGTLPEFKLPVDDPSTQYLYLFFASNDFQRLYRDYRELQRLYMVLVHWQRQFPSFDNMIATHMARLDKLAPKAEKALTRSQEFYQESRTQLQEYETRLKDIIANDDLMGLANVTQVIQKQRLDAIEANLKAMNDPDRYREEWEKLKLLQGLLEWDLNDAAIAKRWQASKDQADMNRMLDELETRIQGVMTARDTRLQRFQGFENRIQTLQQQITALQEQTAAQLRQQRTRLQTEADAIITREQQHLDQMRAKALLAIARLQDRGYMQERQRQDAEAAGKAAPALPPSGGVKIKEIPEDKSPQTLQDAIRGIFSGD